MRSLARDRSSIHLLQNALARRHSRDRDMAIGLWQTLLAAGSQSSYVLAAAHAMRHPRRVPWSMLSLPPPLVVSWVRCF